MDIDLIQLLVGILIFGLIGYVVRWALVQFGAPQPVVMVVMVILLIVFVLWLLSALGVVGPVLHLRRM